ncbi:MAG TPA: phenylalanine--tRNA ligase subunit alpha [Thermomicrobiales bacterium]|jgi:phenylalanyl-tRNA synthetase alpha chain|nr:phenylalanine--tRNA ligase subunit alpha [Thermomicrobiales bacterium]
MTFTEQLEDLRTRAEASLAEAADLAAIEGWERATIGSKGELSAILRQLGGLSADERPAAGRAANAVKVALTEAYTARREQLAAVAMADRLVSDAIDVTLPGRVPAVGGLHPVSEMIEEVSEIFALMGFQTVFGPEVETGHYNFDQLNIPGDHPARDMWDTFLVKAAPGEEVVLRTHTSPMQARVMESQDPPVRVIVPGRCYRYEAPDASHEWAFHQLEGLAVDTNITMADLKGVLREMARQLFGGDRRIRFRCDFFPFVEPGVDFSVDCAVCDGKGCRVCKYTGWLEMGGAGMVHPNVLRAVGYDPDKVTGFAFGLGIERLVMMRHGVGDVRAFAANDLRFLRQFTAGV